MTFSFLSSYLLFPNQTDPNSKAACLVTGQFFFYENPQPQQLLTDLLSLCGFWTSHSQSPTSHSFSSWQLLRFTTYPPCDFSQTPRKGSSSFWVFKISFPTWLRNCRKDLFPSDGGRSAARAAQGVRERKDRSRKTIACCSNRVECFRAQWQAMAATGIN